MQHAFPGEAGLKAFKDQKLKELPVVMERHSPFMVMVFDIERIPGICPAASLPSIGIWYLFMTGPVFFFYIIHIISLITVSEEPGHV